MGGEGEGVGSRRWRENVCMVDPLWDNIYVDLRKCSEALLTGISIDLRSLSRPTLSPTHWLKWWPPTRESKSLLGNWGKVGTKGIRTPGGYKEGKPGWIGKWLIKLVSSQSQKVWGEKGPIKINQQSSYWSTLAVLEKRHRSKCYVREPKEKAVTWLWHQLKGRGKEEQWGSHSVNQWQRSIPVDSSLCQKGPR